MIVDKCPVLAKVGSGEPCFRCSSKLSHTHNCSFNNPMKDHTHKINHSIYKYHVIQNGFQVMIWNNGSWIDT